MCGSWAPRRPTGRDRAWASTSPRGRPAAVHPRVSLALLLVLAPMALAGPAPAHALGSDAGPTVAGTWRLLPRAPIAPTAPIAPSTNAVSIWTGKQLLVFGRAQPNPPWSVDVAAAYTPATGKWRRLTPLHGPAGNYEGSYRAVWTGKEMIVSGPFDFQAFDPATNRWRRLTTETGGGAGGLVVWTGRELIAWGGGCCGDASAAGSAYDPATGAWRKLAASPLAPSQRPSGVWTGRELIVLVSGLDPDGKPYPAGFARAAAYAPKTDTWRRIAALPAPRSDATVVWDGREVLVVGGSGAARERAPAPLARVGFAFDPAADRWRRLAPMASGRTGFAAVWTGKRLFVWGGTTAPPGGAATAKPQSPPRGFVYDPKADRWSALPRSPLAGRLGASAVWTGDAMILWGGSRPDRAHADGAVFAPAGP